MSRLLNSWYKRQQASLSYRRGLSYVCQMSYVKAIAAFSEVVEIGRRKEAEKALVQRGVSYASLKDFKRATDDFDAVIETSQASSPVLAEAHYHRGLLRQQAGNEAGAFADWSAAIAYWPSYPAPHYHRALVSLSQGHYDKALGDLDAALRADPTMVLAYLQRGNLRYQLKDIPGAVADWELAVCNDFSLEEAKQKLASVQQADYDAKLSSILEVPLAALGLKAEVNHLGSTLDIHIHRELGTGVNYYTLPDVIREHLVPLHIADVSRFQLIGHLAEVHRPEWSQFYDLYKGQPCPPSQWQTAFAALVLFPPFGIPAFIQAARVKDLYKKGQYLEAVGASKAVKGLCVAGSVTLGFFTLLPLGYAAYDSMKETPTFRVAEQSKGSPHRPYQQMFQDDAELN